MEDHNKKTIVLAAAELGPDRKPTLSCAAAFALNRQFGISLDDIGHICDEAKIKISSCQLGCFR